MAVRPAERRTLRMRLSRALLRLLGWRLIDRPPAAKKYVVVAAWHTSNWDFVFALLVLGGLGLHANFLGKRELVEGPFGRLMAALGVIGVDRSRSTGLTARVAVVPAEGTRSAAERWKSGFYYMALAADVPIAFGFLDSTTRTVGIDGGFVPSGDLEADVEILRAFYGPKRGLSHAKMGPIEFRAPAVDPAADPAAEPAAEPAPGSAPEPAADPSERTPNDR